MKTFIRLRQKFVIILTALSLICTALLGMIFMKLPTAEKAQTTNVTAEQPRKTPLMGWASWNAYSNDITEERILSQARRLVDLGLADLGYTYVNVDDGWQKGRDEDTGLINVHPDRFPSGMKDLADKIHALGLKAGIYSDGGEFTCASGEGKGDPDNKNVGLYGHDDDDLERFFIEWGYDFIKVDWCGGAGLGLNRQTRYTEISNVIKRIERETGKDKVYNVCCWEFPGDWVTDIADSWRTGADITNTFESVLYEIDQVKNLAKYQSPGHVNDPDMLEVGNGMTYDEDKSHFTMWCMLSSPLMLGNDLNNISDDALSIISNKELIDINQDVACNQATVLKSIGYGNDLVEIWGKDLGHEGSGTKAVTILNRSNKPQTVTMNISDVGFSSVDAVRDLWAHTDITISGEYTVTLPAHGAAALKMTGALIKEIDDKNGIGEVRLAVNGDRLSVGFDAATEKAADCVIAIKDVESNLVAYRTVSVAAGVNKNLAAEFDLDGIKSGTVDVYLLKNNVPLCRASSAAFSPTGADRNIGPMFARSLVKNGAVLLDVRTAEEFENGHLDGAVNIKHTDVLTEAVKRYPDKNTEFVVYCSSAKRSAQAVSTLLMLGYENSYNLGSMANWTAQATVNFADNTCTVVTAGDKINVNYTASPYDKPEVYLAAGAQATFDAAVRMEDFTVPTLYSGYYLPIKAYLAYDGVCYAEIEQDFIYWSEQTVDTFVSDMEWTVDECGFGTNKRDKSIENNTLTLASKTFAKGIGSHATSTITVKIPSGAKKFITVAGCDWEEIIKNNQTTNASTIIFNVLIDGKLVEQSALLRVKQHYIFDIDIPTGAKELTLYADESFSIGGNACDHADWAVAGFVSNTDVLFESDMHPYTVEYYKKNAKTGAYEIFDTKEFFTLEQTVTVTPDVINNYTVSSDSILTGDAAENDLVLKVYYDVTVASVAVTFTDIYGTQKQYTAYYGLGLYDGNAPVADSVYVIPNGCAVEVNGSVVPDADLAELCKTLVADTRIAIVDYHNEFNVVSGSATYKYALGGTYDIDSYNAESYMYLTDSNGEYIDGEYMISGVLSLTDGAIHDGYWNEMAFMTANDKDTANLGNGQALPISHVIKRGSYSLEMRGFWYSGGMPHPRYETTTLPEGNDIPFVIISRGGYMYYNIAGNVNTVNFEKDNLSGYHTYFGFWTSGINITVSGLRVVKDIATIDANLPLKYDVNSSGVINSSDANTYMYIAKDGEYLDGEYSISGKINMLAKRNSAPDCWGELGIWVNDDLEYTRLGNEENVFPITQLLSFDDKRLSTRGYNYSANWNNPSFGVFDNIDINNVEFTVVVRNGKLYTSVAGHNNVFDISGSNGHTYFGFSISGIDFRLTELSLKTAAADIDAVIADKFS